VGSSLPPAELARRDSTLLRKIVYIFYCVGGKFGEVAGVFLAGCKVRRHRTLALASGVLSVLDPARVEHRTHYTGRRVFPVHASGEACLNRGCLFESTGRSGRVRCEGVLQPSLRLSPVSTGPSGAPSPVRSQFAELSTMGPVSTGRVRCSLNHVRWFVGSR